MKKIIALIFVTLFLMLAIVSCDSENNNNSNETLMPSEGLEFTLNEDGESYSVSGIGACIDTTLVIPETHEGKPVTSIGESAFNFNLSIQKLIIPDTIIDIQAYAFRYCKELTDVVMSDSVVNIYAEAFYECTSLKNVTFGNSVEQIIGQVFFMCTSLESVELPDSLKYIGVGAFGYCTALKNIYIPQNVEIDYYAFYRCYSLENINIDEENKYYKSIDGNVYTKDGKTLLCYAPGKTDISFVVPNGVESIFQYAFYDCYALLNITLPDSLMKIQSMSFYNCKNLESINMPSSVKILGKMPFYLGDSSSNSPKSLKYNEYMGGYYLGNEDNPYRVLVKLVSNDLTNFKINDNVEFLLGDIFDQCDNSQFTRYDNAYYVGSENNPYMMLVRGVEGVTSCEIHTNTRIIYHRAFAGLAPKHSEYILENIVVPDSVVIIGDYAFAYSTTLKDISIGNSVESIGESAFSDTQISQIVIPSSVKYIYSNAFSKTNVEEIIIPSSVEYIGYGILSGSKNIKTIYCEVKEKPHMWEEGWDKCAYFGSPEPSVVWNYQTND